MKSIFDVAQAIIAEREAGGPFKTLHDFVERVDSSQANMSFPALVQLLMRETVR